MELQGLAVIAALIIAIILVVLVLRIIKITLVATLAVVFIVLLLFFGFGITPIRIWETFLNLPGYLQQLGQTSPQER